MNPYGPGFFTGMNLATSPYQSGVVHPGVRCDGCQGGVRGIRYKCVTCSDYDLCSMCKQMGLHSHHQMMQIDRPNQGFSFPGGPPAYASTQPAYLPSQAAHRPYNPGTYASTQPIRLPSSSSFTAPSGSAQSLLPLSTANWRQPTPGQPYIRVPIDSRNPEYATVVSNMSANGGSQYVNKITGICRIENYKQYRVYMSCKEEFERVNGRGVQNERLLWHGTSKDVLSNIYRDGFNRSYCGKNATAYGDGVYFATDFSYSASPTYSPPDSTGTRFIFQCRVLTGQFVAGRSGLKEPPMRDNELRYDSVVNDVNSPSMFVIFRDMQAYPEYIISFK